MNSEELVLVVSESRCRRRFFTSFSVHDNLLSYSDVMAYEVVSFLKREQTNVTNQGLSLSHCFMPVKKDRASIRKLSSKQLFAGKLPDAK